MSEAIPPKERFNYLRLIRSERVGPATFHDLLKHCGSAEKAIEALPELSRRGGSKRPIKIAPLSDMEREWELIHRAGARLVALGEADYPRELAHIHAPPPLLTIVGDGHWSTRPAIAIVGSRNSSASGKKLTKTLANELGANNVTVVSGLARGIDTEAHKASLETGTIAVVAGGLNRLYPQENIELAHQIAQKGMLISEMPWDAPARSQDFPRRNRIISGISLGVLVVEAAIRSGSLITSRYALEQGREVFAIPGSPLDPRSSGTNQLIKQGAVLVTECEDILSNLAPQLTVTKPTQVSLREDSHTTAPVSSESVSPSSRNSFIQSLGPTPIAIDELIRLSDLSPAEIQVILLELDLAGRLERHGNQTVSLKP